MDAALRLPRAAISPALQLPTLLLALGQEWARSLLTPW
jgi:hypothetical protein